MKVARGHRRVDDGRAHWVHVGAPLTETGFRDKLRLTVAPTTTFAMSTAIALQIAKTRTEALLPDDISVIAVLMILGLMYDITSSPPSPPYLNGNHSCAPRVTQNTYRAALTHTSTALTTTLPTATPSAPSTINVAWIGKDRESMLL